MGTYQEEIKMWQEEVKEGYRLLEEAAGKVQGMIESTGRLEEIIEAAKRGVKTNIPVIDKHAKYANNTKKNAETFINRVYLGDEERLEQAARPEKLSAFYNEKVKGSMEEYNRQLRRLLKGLVVSDEPAWEIIAKNKLDLFEKHAQNIAVTNENNKFREEYSRKIRQVIRNTPFLYSLISKS
ncbi:hypothetical protein GF367_00950 [Candidatus Woesearchaeota archaeon]|nr:hypothetical protein [Candidatus Woesearchaeota archaeon]